MIGEPKGNEEEKMRGRYMLAVMAILGMGLLAAGAHADTTPAHGHADAPAKPTEPAQGAAGQQSTGQETMGQGMMGQGTMGQGMMGQGMLQMPQMDPARGRKLFASKGCVACHSVNGVGGKDAPPLDATTMERMMNPFEFAAKMWRGAEAMIVLQRDELGEQIEFTGDDLADIIAFTHHPEEQKKFSEADVPPRILELIEHGHGDGNNDHANEEKTDHKD